MTELDIYLNFFLLSFLIIIALYTMLSDNIFTASILLGIYSFICSLIFIILDAIDVALTEASVGGALSTILIFLTVKKTYSYDNLAKKNHNHKNIFSIIVTCLTGCLLFYTVLDMPMFGNEYSPANQSEVIDRYINHSKVEIGIPNVVTSILASYRGFDTLGESIVVFTAGLGIFIILGLAKTNNQSNHPLPPLFNQPAIRIHIKIITPFMMLFALYLQFHGEVSPGGGFQAGVILATALILYSASTNNNLGHITIKMMPIGVSLYILVGFICFFMKGNYLDYSALDIISNGHGQHLGITLVELGICLTVSSVMASIYYLFDEWDTTND